MSKRVFLVVGLAFAAAVPLAAQAYNGVTVAVSTPEFGFRIGAPPYRPYYAPAPAVVPVYPPVVYAPRVIYAPPPVVYAPAPVLVAPRVIYPAAVVIAPPVAYPRTYRPVPRVVVPYDDDHYEGHHLQQAGHWVPPGHAKRYTQKVRYQ